MNQKPKIQYVGQFYVHGSEARQVQLQEEKRQAKTRLPLAKIKAIEKIYVDPVALAGIAVAVLMLVTMVLGAVQLKKEIQDYVKRRTAPYKYPRIVEFKTELPKTTSGKIIRKKL